VAKEANAHKRKVNKRNMSDNNTSNIALGGAVEAIETPLAPSPFLHPHEDETRYLKENEKKKGEMKDDPVV
jgi:hypothetical protein